MKVNKLNIKKISSKGMDKHMTTNIDVNNNVELCKKLKHLAITKQLNFLFGSGVSLPGMPLMGPYFDEVNEKYKDKLSSASDENERKEIKKIIKSEANENLIMEIIRRNKELLNGNVDDLIPSFNKNEIDILSEKVNIIKREDVDEMQYKICVTYLRYLYFISSVINLLRLSNSRQVPRSVNIFTTNYDLFIEKAIDRLFLDQPIVFNDGASGYFHRYLKSSNYNKVVSYKGLNDNYINEIPSINLIKPHGSVNWRKSRNDDIEVLNEVDDDPVIVKPTGMEEMDTFMNNHFHEMLRVFQLELDKPQSVLFVMGFSFQDKHIAKMVKRALMNSELMVYVFCYKNADQEYIKKNLNYQIVPFNLVFIKPSDFIKEESDADDGNDQVITLGDLVKIFSFLNDDNTMVKQLLQKSSEGVDENE